MSASPVSITFVDLFDDSSALYDKLEEAFGAGPSSLGLLVITHLPPAYGAQRDRLLRQSARFAALPDKVKAKYEDAASSYSFGWSHGKEKMNGKPDLHKGSFYANPSTDLPIARSEAITRANPSYYSANIWPSQQDCPSYETDFKTLSSFMRDIGIQLAKRCDELIDSRTTKGKMRASEMIQHSQCSKARLLHYFPVPGQELRLDGSTSSPAAPAIASEDDLCGWHLDHSILTVLTQAMYLLHSSDAQTRPEPLAIPSPNPDAGLYIRTHATAGCASRVLKVNIPPDSVAIQLGEAIQVMSHGELLGTTHCVRAGQVSHQATAGIRHAIEQSADRSLWQTVQGAVITRETLAVFLQPDVDDLLTHDLSFGGFTQQVLSRHY
ncbi:uncharacterized protein L969DRAFT_16112 [Mixia osmundae IAM 14324]|uniref:uncharacterized protein n=1 Tax=Mixia osmundae (strain CBS 9802 / IAM 14324 / JCM 22182 / KY 12970) TaxID=764103 RepID=UPI0004A557D9|nr:uncharacterized protein L969DRAFT_16112 [Mixia osmundae IAM 14324]KEI40749.1 hypothetical protein L969DRAFT_16112 [Mixia osmundae IAM 14324]